MKLLFTAILTLSALFCTNAEVKATAREYKGANLDDKSAYLAQPVRFWGHSGYMTDPLDRLWLLTLSNSKTSFIFNLMGKVNDSGKLTAALGMSRPSQANWSERGFFDFKINGLNSEKCTVEVLNSESTADAGSITLRFSASNFSADVKLMLEENTDMLILEFIPNKTDGKNYPLEFTAYPGSMGGGFKNGLPFRHRRVLTGKRELPINKETALGQDEPWIFFSDTYYDVKNNRGGTGPCALLFDPRSTVLAHVIATDYGCTTRIFCRPGTPQQFILWDFNKWTNESAESYMKELKFSF